MEMVKNGTPEPPKTHLVERASVYSPPEIEAAYSRLNQRAANSDLVIVSTVVSTAADVYLIASQVVPRADLLRMQREQQFSVMPPRGRG